MAARLLRRPFASTRPPAATSLYEWGVSAYREHVQALLATHDREQAFRLAVGGKWESTGHLLVGALVLAGLTPDTELVDVGCGSGRLAASLAPLWHGEYLGIDVVPDLVDYAREQAFNRSWQFETITRLAIPAGDESKDLVCFFSVFTHLPHEQSFIYLREARRILRTGGRAVVSFLELAEESHWCVFEATVDSVYDQRHHNQFVHRDELRTWCDRLGFSIERFIGGQELEIPVLDGLEPTGELTEFGQSLAIIRATHTPR
jgi:2-polyprenyl-3-methyl-5-hydroxy-6-metoxy-1,4-benzoquinol methylase